MEKSINKALMIMGLFFVTVTQAITIRAGGPEAFAEGLMTFFSLVEDASGARNEGGGELPLLFIKTFFDLDRIDVLQTLRAWKQLGAEQRAAIALRNALRACLQQGELLGALLKVQYGEPDDLKKGVSAYVERRKEKIAEGPDRKFVEDLVAALFEEIDQFYASSWPGLSDTAACEPEVERLFAAGRYDFLEQHVASASSAAAAPFRAEQVTGGDAE